MFDAQKIKDGLYGLVGLRQPTNSTYAILNSLNTTSRSGYYSSDNSFCKVEFIVDGIDDLSATNAQINSLIKEMQKTAIVEVCNAVFSDADYIDRNLLFKNAFNPLNTETLPSGFVGYRIIICDKKNIAFEIPRVFLNFKNTGTLTLCLFHSSTVAPLFTKSVTITSINQVADLGWVVDNSGSNYKGEYYFGYVVDQMTGTLEPFKRDYRDSIIKSEFTDLEIENIYVPGVITNVLWDLSTNQFSVVDSFGLNPDITVFQDFTDLILRNEKLFAKAVDLSFQIKIINSYIASIRSNANQRISKELIDQAILELNGVITSNSIVNKVGLIPGLRNEIFNLKTQIDKLYNGYFGKKNEPYLVTLS